MTTIQFMGTEAQGFRTLFRRASSRTGGPSPFRNHSVDRPVERAGRRFDRRRIVEGRLFLVGIALLFSVYFAAIPFMRRALATVADSALVSVPFFLAWLVASLAFVRLSHLPFPRLGAASLTWSQLRLAGTITLTLVLAGVVFDAWLGSDTEARIPTDHGSLLPLLLYVSFVPVQEFIARGILLGGLLHYFRGRWVPVVSCVVCAALYGTLHLYLGVEIALLVFVPGLLWSYLFYRTRTLLPVILSHLSCGLFWMYFLSV